MSESTTADESTQEAADVDSVPRTDGADMGKLIKN